MAASSVASSGAPPAVYFALDKPYESNAYNLSQGKRLYSWFGCKACHADGQGSVGPGFLDGWWYYGPEMVSIFASIRDGRRHGMPAFRDKIPETQLWQLVSYVRALGGLVPSVRLPARSDHLQATPPLSLQERQTPRSGSAEIEP